MAVSEVMDRLRELVHSAAGGDAERMEIPRGCSHGDPGLGVDCTRSHLERSIAIDIAERRAISDACWRKLDTCFRWEKIQVLLD